MKALPANHAILIAVLPCAVAAGITISDRLTLDDRLAAHFAAASAQAPFGNPAAAPWEPVVGRLPGESPELRALRLDEVELFPEFAGQEPSALPTPDQSCGLSDYSRASSIDFLRPQDDFLKGLSMPDLPVRRHERVAKYIRYFTSTVQGRSTFVKWLMRSGRYRNIISEHLSRYDLPQDLASVVFIESGFWPTARSPAGAVGLWQFMQTTGAAYGLTVRPGYDERQNVWAATDAAARHLDDLYTRFRSWDLALAAYNVGYARVEQLTQQLGTRDFWRIADMSEALPRETQLYVPKILAIAVIGSNLEVFGFSDIELEPPISAEPIDVQPHTRLSLVARAAGTSVRELKSLNPQIMTPTVPDIGGPVRVYVPAAGVSRARALLPRLLGGKSEPLDTVVSEDFDWGRDPLNPRGVSALELTDKPSKQKTPKLDTEPQHTPVPEAPPPAPKSVLPPDAVSSLDEAGTDKVVVYEVMAGDTLNKIAETFGLPMLAVARFNHLRNPSKIFAGQEIRLPLEPAKQAQIPVLQELVYRVNRGETLSQLATYFGASVQQLALDNNITDPRSLQEGQLLRVRVAANQAAQDDSESASGSNTVSVENAVYGPVPDDKVPGRP